ncbi:6,7-dimethyl-8-ribityllumazine synthase [Inhella crocodyli]|uniref:6,7-dimethyl-8-ribityllumazine synthase n=1 Tax=Inhella crocodyli TaxID=2499851 RepID=A0A3S2WU73_9BURK|nr:6,7-dimethyl-8-ribityllumazine synthase [Inhella crocodyli]RVT88028.1 6,7-dimethyl-8-ribityllumazine synthase [Inhella crocodyli]
MQGAELGSVAGLDGRGLRVGIVRARFNDGITRALQEACEAELARLGASVVARVEVGGALEVPLALQALAKRGGVHALVALGCIIRGETYHFELVANESGAGVTRVGLDAELPIANVILTVENEAQAWARIDKGRDGAQVAVEMAQLLKFLRTETPS